MRYNKRGRPRKPPKVEVPPSTNVYVYARVSKDDGRDGESQSIENQVLRCRAFIEDYIAKRFPDHKFVADNLYIDDGVSGGKPFNRRPGGGRLALKMKPGDVVVMTSWDRGFRNLLDFLETFQEWRKQGISVITVNMPLDPTDEMHAIMIKFMALMGDTERALIIKRIRDALDARIQQGRPGAGNAPYGYKMIGKKGEYLVVPSRDERRLGNLIVSIYDNEEISFYGVQERIREMYAKNKNSKWLIWRNTGETPHGIRCREIYMRCKAGWPYYQGRNYEDVIKKPYAIPEEGEDDQPPAD